jgi:Protein of unknown function (DUF3574)
MTSIRKPSPLRSLGVALALACVLGGCRASSHARALAVPASTPVCAADERAMLRETLYFGRSRPDGGSVSDAQWRSFVDDAIVPRFPDGFTVLAAEGHWRGGNGAIVREASQVVIVLHSGDAVSRAAVASIAADYKRMFAQEAVLRERSWSCAGF